MNKIFSTSDNFAKLNLVKIKFEHPQLKKMKFETNEILLLKKYCKQLGYFFSINDQHQTVRVYNPINKKYGYLRKIGNEIYYGYMKKIEESTFFIKKYSIKGNLAVFNMINNTIKTPQQFVLSSCTGIIDLDIQYLLYRL